MSLAKATLAPVLAGAFLCGAALGCGHASSSAERPAGSDVAARSDSPAQAGAAAQAAEAPAELKFVKLDELQGELKARRKAGKPVLVNFWATWCGPCVDELPDLAGLAREWGKDGPQIVGVSLDSWIFPEASEAESKVRALLAKSHVTFANLIYQGDQDPLLNAFDMPGPIPYSILYDGAGKTLATYVGPVDIDDAREVGSKALSR